MLYETMIELPATKKAMKSFVILEGRKHRQIESRKKRQPPSHPAENDTNETHPSEQQ